MITSQDARRLVKEIKMLETVPPSLRFRLTDDDWALIVVEAFKLGWRTRDQRDEAKHPPKLRMVR